LRTGEWVMAGVVHDAVYAAEVGGARSRGHEHGRRGCAGEEPRAPAAAG